MLPISFPENRAGNIIKEEDIAHFTTTYERFNDEPAGTRPREKNEFTALRRNVDCRSDAQCVDRGRDRSAVGSITRRPILVML